MASSPLSLLVVCAESTDPSANRSGLGEGCSTAEVVAGSPFPSPQAASGATRVATACFFDVLGYALACSR